MKAKPGVKQTEVGMIPEDWEAVDYVMFGQIIDGDRGEHYPSAGDSKNDGYCLFLNAGNVTKAGFRFSECQFISADKDRKLNKGKLARGDVILTTRGTVGNFAYFNDGVPYEHVRINSGMVILRNASPNITNAYQYLVLRSDIVSSQIARLSFGSAQPQLTVKGISTIKIPIPPTKYEQDAIAEALSDADALVESLEQLLTKKRHLKQGGMQELLTGKKRLPAFSHGQQTYRSTKFGLMPADWVPKSLERVAAFITKGSTPTTYGFAWQNEGVLFLRSECVAESWLDLSQSMFISARAHQVLRRSEVRAADILMTITGNVGRVVHLGRDFGEANINQHIARIRVWPTRSCSNFSLSHWLEGITT
jgi:type I restriction enzyme, S subunit